MTGQGANLVQAADLRYKMGIYIINYIVGAAKMAQRSQQLRWHMGCPAIEPVKNDRSGFRQYVPCIRDGA